MSQASVFISGTGLYTPEESISNEELVIAFNQYVENHNNANSAAIAAGDMEALQPSSAAFIEKASGIKQRYVLNKAGILDPDRMCPILPERSNDEPSIQCEMSVKAAEQALANAGKTAADVDAVIVACSNMQRPYPAVAVEVQAALGIQGYGFDMNVACSSATFGLQSAADAIRSGSAGTVLVLNPEICTGHLNFRDRDSHFIFGDACTAMVVESGERVRSDNAYKILGTRLQTAYSNNIRNNFGFLNRGDETGVGQVDKLFVQNGRKVFKEVVPMVAQQISAHLTDLDIDPMSVKRLWLHQANLSMNQLVCKKVVGSEVNDDIAPVILDRYANTSSAGSVIAFHLYQQGFKSGDQGVLCSFGAGYSIGSVILEKA